jgi:N-acetylneuraminate lyase
MAEVAAGAPDLPFYYSHSPAMTGVEADMVRFLEVAPKSVPSLIGLKMTGSNINMLPECAAMEQGRFNILFGCDEMLLASLAMGADGAVGTTYNYLAPLYNAIIGAFRKGETERARALQRRASAMIRAILRTCGHSGLKACMAFVGHDRGPQRLPLAQSSRGMLEELREKLDALGFFQWSRPGYPDES